jgi:hypothetical protein
MLQRLPFLRLMESLRLCCAVMLTSFRPLTPRLASIACFAAPSLFSLLSASAAASCFGAAVPVAAEGVMLVFSWCSVLGFPIRIVISFIFSTTWMPRRSQTSRREAQAKCQIPIWTCTARRYSLRLKSSLMKLSFALALLVSSLSDCRDQRVRGQAASCMHSLLPAPIP